VSPDSRSLTGHRSTMKAERWLRRLLPLTFALRTTARHNNDRLEFVEWEAIFR
jgi:hypothetical protein